MSGGQQFSIDKNSITLKSEGKMIKNIKFKIEMNENSSEKTSELKVNNSGANGEAVDARSNNNDGNGTIDGIDDDINKKENPFN